MDVNAAVGGKAGLSPTIEAALGTGPGSNLTERQRIALEYAERVSVTPVDVPGAFFPQLRGLFSEREIVELTAHIAHENYNAKFNRPLRVAANDFCALPLPANTDTLIRTRRPVFQAPLKVELSNASASPDVAACGFLPSAVRGPGSRRDHDPITTPMPAPEWQLQRRILAESVLR